jgi:hypothetical protein
MRPIALGLLLALVFTLSACGDDSADPPGTANAADVERFCELDAEWERLSDFDIDTPPDELEANFNEATSLFDEAMDIAPEAIAADFTLWAEWQLDFFDVVADAGYDNSAMDPERVAQLLSPDTQQELAAALESVAAWSSANC